MQLTLEQLFGLGSYQSPTQLIVSKAGLRGLNIKLDNPQALLAAIMNTAIDVFSGSIELSNGEILTTDKNELITYDNSALYLINTELWRISVVQTGILHIFLFKYFINEN